MPGKVRKVNVGLKVNKPGITVSVTPWAVHVEEGDQVEWIAKNAAIKKIKIDKSSKAAKWPFARHASGRRFTARPLAPRTGRRVAGLRTGKVVRYDITIDFTDPNGNIRKAKIDPDMIID